MTVLGIETSCDETAAAVVREGRDVLSSIVFSQVPLHQPYGGVVPEIASRSHIEKLPGVIGEALAAAGLEAAALDAVAVTYGPGLASSLLVGLSAAKGLAWSLNRPLIGINHVEAHIHSVFLAPDAPPAETVLPLLALVVSGGHSALVRVGADRRCRVLGQTLDDAAGEAFDKAAKLLGLGYPGGPVVEQAARRATHPAGIVFPQGRIGADNPALGRLQADLCFSFSGLKTSLLTHLRRHPLASDAQRDALAAAYQEAIVAALASRCERALQHGAFRALAVGGGVSLNGALRARLAEVAARAGVPLLLPLPRHCGDNAAMIAALAGMGGGVTGEAAFRLDATPGLPLGE
ncbi:MAG: tRNA (adenosine(37)-N6)-threonylcarbamoyltransferase complex transferase subunit TsaD [Lentisphaerae bacterium]|nr:tRNA (adenosine(37)-N6)-threonylcarbamoyltransferase complex transferase subunit TsaD [Lentisphaerota bacterium]